MRPPSSNGQRNWYYFQTSLAYMEVGGYISITLMICLPVMIGMPLN